LGPKIEWKTDACNEAGILILNPAANFDAAMTIGIAREPVKRDESSIKEIGALVTARTPIR